MDTLIEFSADSATVWKKEAVKLLIYSFKELGYKCYPQQKVKWIAISNIMKRNGYNYSPGDCDQKWRNLKKSYRFKSQNKTKKHWQYYDMMEEVLRNKINENNNAFQSGDNFASMSGQSDTEHTDDEECANYDCQKDIKLPVWFRKLQERRKDDTRELISKLQNMHRETIEMMEKRNSILQCLVELI